MLLILVVFVGLMIAPTIPARSQGNDGSLSQWIISIETRPVPNMFRYKGSKLTPVSEAKVSVRAAHPDAVPAAYEMFWGGANGKTLGLERYGMLRLPRGDSVAFKISHASEHAQYTETRLAVDALLRLVLDLQLNSNLVFSVRVPTDSYDDVVNALQEKNFLVKSNAPETPLMTTLVISIVDESGWQKCDLYYPSDQMDVAL